MSTNRKTILDVDRKKKSKKRSAHLRAGKKTKLSPYGLWLLDNFNWTMTDLPHKGVLSGGDAAIAERQFHATIGKGQVKLFVPMINPDLGGPNFVAVKKLKIKKPNNGAITMSDILYRIFTFYNIDPLTKDDFDQLLVIPQFQASLSSLMQQMDGPQQLYKIDVLSTFGQPTGQPAPVYFNGLEHRGGTKYYVKVKVGADPNPTGGVKAPQLPPYGVLRWEVDPEDAYY